MNTHSLFAKLIDNYRMNARFLPWRTTQSPYEIWVSEIILQQTRVLQGQDYFMTFLRYFPDVFSLASAQENEVLKVWQGLGYYSRAMNLHKSAKYICEELAGKFPDNYDDLRKLKGVGDYTAAAIASIVYGLPHAAVDGNVKRVASRFWGIYNPIDKPETVKQITAALNEIIHQFSPGEFNQAMMELGALVCTPKNPQCTTCPLMEGCFAYRKKTQAELPVITPKKKATNVFIEYLFADFSGETLLIKRDHSGIWKGLHEFPSKQVEKLSEHVPDWMNSYFKKGDIHILGYRDYVHKLTHRTIFARFWHMSGMPAIIVSQNPNQIDITITRISDFPVHRLMQKFLIDEGIAERKDNQ